MTTNTLPYQPMRSLLYVDLGKEEYRVKLEHFLYKTHIPESISIFEPYVSKYAAARPRGRRQIRPHPHAAHGALLAQLPRQRKVL